MAIVLPGDVAIEKIFPHFARGKSAEFEKVSGSRDVAVILASLQGRDHHDCQRGLCEQLGLNSDNYFRCCSAFGKRDQATRRQWINLWQIW